MAGSYTLQGRFGQLFLDHRGYEWRATLTLPEDATGAAAAEAIALAEQAVGKEVPARWADALSLPGTICIDNPAEHADVIEAMERAGFALAVAEDEMSRATALTAAHPLPGGFIAREWDGSTAPLFHHAYFEAFSDRPGFPAWDEARWSSAFAGGPGFRGDLSRVVLDLPEPAAFAVLWVEDGAGWVTQMGVRPGWRGQGIGEWLLSHALASFAKEGIGTCSLEVATNNPRARGLYERMGFKVTGRYRSWRKPA